MRGDLGVFGDQRAQERFAIHREVQRLADAHVVERRDRAVDPQVGGFRVRIGEIGLRIGGIDLVDQRRDVGFAGGHHGRADGIVGAEDIGRLGPKP